VSEFSIFNLPQGAIQYLFSIRDTIWLDPPYQRLGDIWPIDKRQLLVDSVINGFDIPKLYFHELVPARKVGRLVQKYAIIDGKQRLGALWGFIDGNFALGDDFEYLHDDQVKAAGLTYRDLGVKYPLLKARFDATSLAVVAVRTDDLELIEDMFSRLNEAVPLNAPEKRNAFGGPLPKAIRLLAGHPFFANKLPFSDRRFRHRDLATKFMLIESTNEVADTKKAYLDAFVKQWADEGRTDRDAAKLTKSVETHIERMSRIFVNDDRLLESIGMTLLVFHFFRFLHMTNRVSQVRREFFEDFEVARQQNRQIAEVAIGKANYDLLEFDKYVQTPNDAYATRLRLSILIKFMREKAKMDLPKKHAYFKTEL
jgi:hypothetical protein